LSALDSAISRWDVVRFLRRHGLEVRLTETGEAHTQCPRCHDSKYRLYINRRTKNWICFNCSVKGRSAVSYVKWVLDCDDAMAVRAIVESSDRSIRDDEDEDIDELPRPTEEEVALPLGYRALKLPADAKSQPYWEYVINRNITPSMVRQYAIGYCRRGVCRGRIIVPITVFGIRRGWVGRTISDDVKRKYLNPPNVHMSRLLFNIDNVMQHGAEKIILVEGIFDALRLPDRAVCTFGKKISVQQIELLGEAGFRKLIFCYDGDAIADAAHYIKEAIPLSMQCYRAALPAEYDPGNAPLTVLSKAIRDAEPWNLASVGV